MSAPLVVMMLIAGWISATAVLFLTRQMDYCASICLIFLAGFIVPLIVYRVMR